MTKYIQVHFELRGFHSIDAVIPLNYHALKDVAFWRKTGKVSIFKLRYSLATRASKKTISLEKA
ncbi:MAG: hypothetical protein ACTSUE_22655 [Promethearchaeota archaeon]